MEFVRYEKRDRIAFLTMDRPEVMNALHPPAHEELDACWDDFAADADCWVAVVTGAGDRAFSAGNDLKWTAQYGTPRMPKSGFGGITSRFDLWKPVVAAVNGVALGGGLEIALACDVVVAAEHATLGLPEPRVGLMAAAGGVHRLPRHVPLKTAMGMMLTGKPITAVEAHRLGLVNEVVPAAQLADAAELEGLGRPLVDALRTRYPAVERLWASEDVREGPRAFADKRPPRWKGR
jgi:enoyl-CoA hydratase/carnithine racemase